MDYNTLSASEQIKIFMKRRKITLLELAAKLQTTPGNLANKFRRNDLRESEIRNIAEALGTICTIKIEE